MSFAWPGTTADARAGDTQALEKMRQRLSVGGTDSGAMTQTLKPASVSRLNVLQNEDKQNTYSPELPCPAQPPPVMAGEGTERNYGMEITTYRCQVLSRKRNRHRLETCF